MAAHILSSRTDGLALGDSNVASLKHGKIGDICTPPFSSFSMLHRLQSKLLCMWPTSLYKFEAPVVEKLFASKMESQIRWNTQHLVQ